VVEGDYSIETKKNFKVKATTQISISMNGIICLLKIGVEI
jgi:hypothetical protein